MKILIASDHAGFTLKEVIKSYLAGCQDLKINDIQDFGTNSVASMDYPDVVHPLCKALPDNPSEALGILICGTGNGVCMTANKYSHVRAALCWNEEIATLARHHNNANILCLPARFIEKETALKMITVFLNAPFEGGRHENRVRKITR